MRNTAIILIVMLLVSCKNELQPTIENINAIFQSKDFSVEFKPDLENSYQLSFREDYMTFKSTAATQRKDLSYAEAEMINNFVQDLFSKKTEQSNHKVLIYNDFQSVTFSTPDYKESLKELLTNLQLDYVSH